jgi:hypothetical protein
MEEDGKGSAAESPSWEQLGESPYGASEVRIRRALDTVRERCAALPTIDTRHNVLNLPGPPANNPGVTNSLSDVLRGMNAVDSTTCADCLDSSHAAIAVGRLVVEVRADRLCRFAALRALMRATDLRVGGCLRPRRFDNAATAKPRRPSTS